MNVYEKTLKSMADDQLIQMLINSHDYEPEALAAARALLLSRSYTEMQIDAVVIQRKGLKDEKQEFLKSIDKEREGPVTENTINALSIVMLVLLLIAAFFHVLTLMRISSGIQGAFPAIIDPLIGFSLLPYALYEFYKRRKAGWIILTAFLFLKLCQLAIPLILMIVLDQVREASGLVFLPLLILITVPAVLFWLVSKKRIRERFGIRKTTLWFVTGITGGLCLLYYLFRVTTGGGY